MHFCFPLAKMAMRLYGALVEFLIWKNSKKTLPRLIENHIIFYLCEKFP